MKRRTLLRSVLGLGIAANVPGCVLVRGKDEIEFESVANAASRFGGDADDRFVNDLLL